MWVKGPYQKDNNSKWFIEIRYKRNIAEKMCNSASEAHRLKRALYKEFAKEILGKNGMHHGLDEIRNKCSVENNSIKIFNKKKYDEEKKEKGKIYFICEDGRNEFVKIGFSLRSAYTRLKELQTSNPRKLKVIAIVKGSMEEEKKLHKRFNEERVSWDSEWFVFSDRIRNYVDNLLEELSHAA